MNKFKQKIFFKFYCSKIEKLDKLEDFYRKCIFTKKIFLVMKDIHINNNLDLTKQKELLSLQMSKNLTILRLLIKMNNHDYQNSIVHKSIHTNIESIINIYTNYFKRKRGFNLKNEIIFFLFFGDYLNLIKTENSLSNKVLDFILEHIEKNDKILDCILETFDSLYDRSSIEDKLKLLYYLSLISQKSTCVNDINNIEDFINSKLIIISRNYLLFTNQDENHTMFLNVLNNIKDLEIKTNNFIFYADLIFSKAESGFIVPINFTSALNILSSLLKDNVRDLDLCIEKLNKILISLLENENVSLVSLLQIFKTYSRVIKYSHNTITQDMIIPITVSILKYKGNKLDNKIFCLNLITQQFPDISYLINSKESGYLEALEELPKKLINSAKKPKKNKSRHERQVLKLKQMLIKVLQDVYKIHPERKFYDLLNEVNSIGLADY